MLNVLICRTSFKKNRSFNICSTGLVINARLLATFRECTSNTLSLYSLTIYEVFTPKKKKIFLLSLGWPPKMYETPFFIVLGLLNDVVKCRAFFFGTLGVNLKAKTNHIRIFWKIFTGNAYDANT